MLEIALFGEPRFRVGGRLHGFHAPPRTMPLLAYLLLHRATPVARDALAGMFWPDSDDETARANLRRHLHYIRKALPQGEWLCVDAKSVQWNEASEFRLDVADFELQSRLPELRVLAAKLYVGDLYTSCEEEWIYFERERLRGMQTANLASLAEEAERSFNHVRAAEYARELLALEPWREDAVRILIRSRMQTGDRGGALEEYEQFAQRLHDELGVEPMPETQALYEACVTEGQSGVPPVVRPHALVGRHGELEELLLQWRTTVAGRATVALVGGEAGVGKSTLLAELAGEVRATGGVPIVAEIGSAGEAPFAPIVRAFSQVRHQAFLRTASSAPTVGALTGTSDRGAFFASVASALQTLSETSPVLFILEDLQWAGADTIALVEFLERRLRDARVMIAASYREEAISPDHPLRGLRRVFGDRATYRHVVLNSLLRSDVERLARERLGEEATPERVDALYRRTGGNALFLTELLETLATGDGAAIPATIRELVENRYRSLTDAARPALDALAVAGTTLAGDLVRELLGTQDAMVASAVLAELEGARFVQPVEGNANVFTFHHEIVRDSLYELVPPDRRVELHLVAAEAMERAASQYASAIAEHYERAGELHRAARAYLRAAAAALQSFANADAERYARKALALDNDERQALKAYQYLYQVYHRSGDRRRQVQSTDEMERIAEHLGDPLEIAEAIYHRLARSAFENDIEETRRNLTRLRDVAPDDAVWGARISAFAGAYDVMRGDLTAAWRHLHHGLDLCRVSGYRYGELYCSARLLEISDGEARPYEPLLRQARELQQQLGDPDSAFLLANAEADLFLHVDRAQCQHSALRMIDAGEQTGDQIYIGVGHMYLAAIASYRFEPEAAEHHFSLAEKLLRDTARRIDLARFYRFRGLYNFTIGDFAAGLADSIRSLEIAREAHTYDLMAMSAGNALYAYLLLGEYDAAEAFARNAAMELEPLGEQHVGVHHFRLSIGLLIAAKRGIEEALPLMEASFEQHAIRGAKLHAAWVGTSLAYELARHRRLDQARPYAEYYLAILPDMIDEGWMPQLTLWQTAQVFRALGERERAQALMQRAADVMSRRLRALREEQQRRFMEYSAHREILRAHSENVWPTL